MSPRIRVLVADDSVVIRQGVAGALAGDPDIEIVGVARNGREAVEQVLAHEVDVVIMDVEMPELDGVGALRQIRSARRHTKVIMFSTQTQRGSRATVDAMTSGAADYVTKPEGTGSLSAALDRVRADLLPRIKAICAPRVAAPRPPTPAPPPRQRPQLIVIGSSTGGPDALMSLLRALPDHLTTPIAIAQHMPAGFTRMLAERLSVAARRPVVEATGELALAPRTITLAPGDLHLRVAVGTGHQLRAKLSNAAPENQVRPSVDVLFRSAAEACGAGVLAIVLTGMGKDGLAGAAAIGKAGGYVAVQDEASSVVWGMPGSVARAQLAHAIHPVPELAQMIARAERGTMQIPVMAELPS